MRHYHHPDRKDISEQAKAKILGENAKRFYGWQ
jgi:predicted TIM-barrel fold metal-dependent hydrolase